MIKRLILFGICLTVCLSSGLFSELPDKPEYGIGYATAPSPVGPWTKPSDNPLVVQNLEIGVSGPGHNFITVSPDGRERFMVYHAHTDPKRPSGNRTVNIDRLIITDNGHLRLFGPTRSPQPLPGGVNNERKSYPRQ